MLAGISDREESGHQQQNQHGGVSTWRSEVQLFFQHDWEKLRKLILRMEEQSWGNSITAAATDRVESSRAIPNVRPARHAASAETHAVAARESEQEVPKQNRLAELAERIEQRIKAANTRTHET